MMRALMMVAVQRSWKLLYGTAAVLVMTLIAAPALAQDKAGAEAAFREGRTLMNDGKHAEACKQFQLSNELDPALGTLLNLADCHDKIGKTASAWAEFTEVADKAGRVGQKTRVTIAQRRAKALEPRLVRLKLEVSADDAPSGLVIKRNGQDVSRMVNSALPVDPGSYQIEASAEGYNTWSKTVDVQGEGTTTTVAIPALEKVPEKPRVQQDTGTRDVTGSSSTLTSKRRNRRIIAAATGGVGVVSLGVGLLFGNNARTKNNDSEALCDADNVCTDEGFDLRKDAQSAATKSNVFVGLGIAAVAAGAVLWITAPDPESAETPSARLAPSVAPNHVGLTLTGSF